MQLAPEHAAAALGALAAFVLLALAWLVCLTRRSLRQERDLRWLRQERDRLTVEVRSLQNQIGWEDGLTKTQHLDPEVMARSRAR